MKKLLLFILVAIACGWLAATQCLHSDQRSPQQQFREAMNHVWFKTYADHDMGYSFYYPSFFHRDEEPSFGLGHVRFSYHLLTNLELECRVLPESAVRFERQDTVVEGYSDHSQHYRYTTHYLKKHRRWYVLSFRYPADYASAVGRINYFVKTWDVGEPPHYHFKDSITSR